MEILKTHWIGDGENVRVLMPITKVDTEHRTVSGFATVNNVDKSDDVVTASASEEAFMTFRGNIREMHQPIAAGKLVSFNQAPFYDAMSGQTYLGVYVTAYVSKGAQDTWEKVLDGTLSGFSIGAHILEQHSEYVADMAKTIRFITKLSLFELSLVDNPANQFANVLSIQKVGGELVLKGLAVDVETQNVFWCDSERLARASSDSSASCIQCSADMTNIGWIEVTDSLSAPEELKKFVDNWVEKVITAQQIKEQTSETVSQNSEFANEEKEGDNSDITVDKSEGGVNVSKEETVVEKAAEVSEVEETETVEKVVITDVSNNVEVESAPGDAAEDASEPVDKAVEVSEDVIEKAEEIVEEDLVAKAIAALTDLVTKQASSLETLTLALTEVQKSVEGIATIAEGVTKANEAVEKVSGKVEGLERATATKKSGDDDSSDPVKKAFSWDGHFASANSISN